MGEAAPQLLWILRYLRFLSAHSLTCRHPVDYLLCSHETKCYLATSEISPHTQASKTDNVGTQQGREINHKVDQCHVLNSNLKQGVRRAVPRSSIVFPKVNSDQGAVGGRVGMFVCFFNVFNEFY